MLDRPYTDAEIDAAVQALSAPEALKAAQDLVADHAPQLQRVLDQALEAGGWFGNAHEQALLGAAGKPDVDERIDAVRTLVHEETTIGMYIGVTVGIGLARELQSQDDNGRTDPT